MYLCDFLLLFVFYAGQRHCASSERENSDIAARSGSARGRPPVEGGQGRAGKKEKRGREYTAPGRHAVLRGVRRAHRGSGTEATVGERRKKRKRKKAEYREKGSKKGGCGREQAREGGWRERTRGLDGRRGRMKRGMRACDRRKTRDEGEKRAKGRAGEGSEGPGSTDRGCCLYLFYLSSWKSSFVLSLASL